jgi:hypothetical protein
LPSQLGPGPLDVIRHGIKRVSAGRSDCAALRHYDQQHQVQNHADTLRESKYHEGQTNPNRVKV